MIYRLTCVHIIIAYIQSEVKSEKVNRTVSFIDKNRYLVLKLFSIKSTQIEIFYQFQKLF